MTALAEARAAAGVQTAQLSAGVTAYHVSGEAGPWVVLVHGILTPSFAFEPLAEMLAAHGFRVLRYDQFGRGLSDRPVADYDLAYYVGQLRELTDRLGIDTMHLIGWSMGAVIASRFAADAPGRVASLCLIAPGLFLRPPYPLRVARRLPGAATVIAAQVGTLIGRLAPLHLSDPAACPDYGSRTAEQLRFPGVGRSFAATVLHFPIDAGSDFSWVGEHPRPVLVIWGDADRVTPYANAPRVLDCFRQATLLTVPGARHAVHLDHADVVHPAIRDFLLAATAAAN
ncbi:alpha/beta hydrolase [Mycobacterium sp. M1]|uniref:Alpha/beta hydrolase n=1 Tax=Mycolicibacter acidiphilus TaxID=2835306 RepID=A0ABS5RPH7_9MYCO|nr:alpha/beta hydrolase [Mycolicibacter acidiphilus]MBS9536099.1 alpha/beta hydrolase [Mycolicibacter acidiphilus]